MHCGFRAADLPVVSKYFCKEHFYCPERNRISPNDGVAEPVVDRHRCYFGIGGATADRLVLSGLVTGFFPGEPLNRVSESKLPAFQ
jgi:hypothetical protein